MHTTKIATCSYCGARTVLQLTARGGHELACASCGAPVHEMKALKTSKSGGKRRPAPSGYIEDIHGPARASRPSKPKKRRKSRFWDALEEVADLVEDIFD